MENPHVVSELPKKENEDSKLIYYAKDNLWSLDFPTTASSLFLKDFFSGCNATVIGLLAKAGYVLAGKTVLDELSCGGTGLHAVTGPLFNPYDSTRIVGGSSSGSALVVSKKLASFALGSDTGGSVIEPSSFCGLVGFKPAYGSVSRLGLIPFCSLLDTVGVMARSVEVVEKIYRVLAKADPMDLWSLYFWKKRAKQVTSKEKSLFQRVVVFEGLEKFLDSGVAELYRHSLAQLKEKGYTIVQKKLPLGLKESIRTTWISICFSQLVSHLNSFQGISFGFKKSRNKKTGVVEKRSLGIGSLVKQRMLVGGYILNKQLKKVEVDKAYFWRTELEKWASRALKKNSFFLFPSSVAVAGKKEHLENDKNDLSLGSGDHWSNNLNLWVNLIRFPSITVPVGKVGSLPVGLNLVGFSNEEEMFKVSQILRVKD